MRRRTKANLNWNIWKPPSNQNIHYSSIYEKRRDFQRFTRKMKIEGPYLSEMSSCCIFDHTIEDPLEKQIKMDVIFFDLNGKINCLLLQLVFDENILNRKYNSLLVFLNKSNMCKMYELYDSCLYINCKDGLNWPLFYDLFGFLIQKPSKTIIGVTFYVHFICKHLILEELNFLHIYSTCVYETKRFHFKSENYPESKKISKYPSPTLQAPNSYTLPLKRKLTTSKLEISNCKHNVYKVCCRCKETKWCLFKPILKSDGFDYKHILEAKGILNNFNSHFAQLSVSYSDLYGTFSTKGKGQPTESFKDIKLNTLKDDIKNDLPSKRKFSYDCTEKDTLCIKEKHSKLYNDSMTREAIEEKVELMKNTSNMSIDVLNKATNVTSCSTSLLSGERNEAPSKQKILVECKEKINSMQYIKESIPCQNHMKDKFVQNDEAFKDNSFKNIKPGLNSVHIGVGKNIGAENQNLPDCQSEFPTFQTASGKSLSISDKARQIAEKLYTEVCSQATDHDKQETKNPSSTKSRKEFNDEELDSFFLNVFDERDNQCDSSSTQSNVNSQFQQAKARKSLGGRRTLKPYSHRC